jgi:hypothetical protein
VAYRSKNPDKETLDRVEKKLKDNDIDGSQLADWPADNNQQAESSTGGGSPNKVIDRVLGEIRKVLSNILNSL